MRKGRIMKQGRSVARSIILALPLLAVFLAAGCEDTMTEKLKEEVRIAALADRSLTILAPATGATLTPAAGTHTVKDGESFSISATLDSGYTFIQWEKDSGTGTVTFADATATSTTVRLSGGDATIKAAFSNVSYLLTISVVAGGYSSFTSKAVVESKATQIVAYPYPTYKFTGWEKASGAGIVAFGDPSLATTTVTLSGGAATIRPTFAKATPSLAPMAGGSTYVPGTNTFPSFFRAAVCESNRLAVLGSSTSGGTNSILGYVNVEAPKNLLGFNGWSGTEMTAITASPTYLYATTDVSTTNAILSVRLSDGQFGTISSGTGAVGGRAIHWDGSTLWALTYPWAVREISTSSLKPTASYTLTDEDAPSLSINGLTSSSRGLILIGTSEDDDQNYFNQMSIYTYPIATGTHTSPYYRTADLTSGWNDMYNEPIPCVSVNPDREYAAVIAPYSDGSFYIKILDWTVDEMDLMGSVQICTAPAEVYSCFYADNYILATGIKDSKATIWIVDASNPSSPTVAGVYQNASYAGGAFYICHSSSSLSTYFVVCKKTASGTEKLEVIPLTLSEN
jgi:hypothetical protein